MKCKKCKREIEDLKVCPYCKAKNIKDSVIKGTTKAIDGVDNEIKEIKFLNAPFKIANILIVLLLIYMLLSIGYNYISDLGLLDLIGNNFFYIVLSIYFILLKTKFGKERFSYMNLVIAILLAINFLGSFFNLLTTFNFTTSFSLIANVLFITYFVNTFFYKYIKKISIINNLNNKFIFYAISIILIILYILMLIKYISVFPMIKIIKYIVEFVILVLFARYIYLYKEYSSKETMFKEIKKMDKNLPSNKEVQNHLKNIFKKYNMYQVVAAFIVVIGIIIGIIVGNNYSVCSSYSKINNMCLEQSFNFGIMLVIWIITLILGVVLSALGKIIDLLSGIEKKLNNNSKK